MGVSSMKKSDFNKKLSRYFVTATKARDLQTQLNDALSDLGFDDFHITLDAGDGFLLVYECDQWGLSETVIDLIFSSNDEKELLEKLKLAPNLFAI